jgi:archaellum component FlaC
MSIKNIFSNGVLIDVNISAWTGEKQLTADDLGIDPEKLPASFKLGKKSLIPTATIQKFRHLDYLARKTLENKSYKFPFGSARFIPKKIFDEFNTEFETLKNNYMALVSDLVTNYDSYKRQMRTEFISAAKEAYERLTKLNNIEDQILCIPRIEKDANGKDVTVMKEVTQDQYINEFLERIERCYPKVESLSRRFSMDFVAFQMELPDLTEATIDDVAEEHEKINLLQEAFQKKMRKEMESYAENIVRENRDRANDIIQTMTANIKNKKRFTETTYNMVLNMINTFISLNITDDIKLEQALMNFKIKYLDGFSSKQIRESTTMQIDMLKDLTQINTIIQDASEIQALAESYRTKIKM